MLLGVVVMVGEIEDVVRDTTTSSIRMNLNFYVTTKGRYIISSIRAEISSNVYSLGPSSRWFDKMIADDVVTPYASLF
jgi:hypothetical protein